MLPGLLFSERLLPRDISLPDCEPPALLPLVPLVPLPLSPLRWHAVSEPSAMSGTKSSASHRLVGVFISVVIAMLISLFLRVE